MPQSTPDAKFPNEVWNGLTSTTADVGIEKSPDIEMGNRLRAEIRGVETVLQPYIVDMATLHAYGSPGEVLTIDIFGTGFEWSPGNNTIELINNNPDALVIGNAVYVKTNGGMDKAQASAANTVEFLGLVADTMIPAMAGGRVQVAGFLETTTERWDSVTGDSTGLVTGSIYYLDPNAAGKITKIAPVATDQYVVRVGQAISPTIMNIQTTISVLL